MFANIRKECFLHFMGMADISVIVSDINGNAKLFVYLGDCNKALTSREYPTAELLQFCETYFKGIYQVNGVPKEKAEMASWKAQPITIEFLKKNFDDYDANNDVYSTMPKQSPKCVNILPCFGKFVISVYDETMDNCFTASTIGQLVTFLNLCGLQSFTSTLKM